MDAQLKKMIAQSAKAPRNFAFSIKGKDIALQLSKKPIKSGDAKALKTKVGGSKIHKGVCHGDDDGLAFKSVDPIPTNIAPMMRNHIKAETGLSTAPHFVVVSDLVEVDDDSADIDVPVDDKTFSDPSGAAVDVDGRLAENARTEYDQMKTHLADYAGKRRDLLAQLDAAKQTVADFKTQSARISDEQVAIIDDDSLPAESQKQALADLKDRATKCEQGRAQCEVQRKEAARKIAALDKVNREYQASVAAYDAATTDGERAQAVQAAQIKRIAEVRAAMDKVYADTGRKLMILGRLAQTIGGEDSWLEKHRRDRQDGTGSGKDEEGRVLSAGAWSMAVNDAFVKSGLDQKAQVMLATEFNEHDPADTKKIIQSLSREVRGIIANADGSKSKQQVKDEVRQLVKDRFIENLKGDPSRNDGFSIYMLEIEQLIDDNYVLMIHNPEDDGANPKGGIQGDPDAPPEGAKQVMVPSGTGQKIKAELSEAVEARERRKAEAAAVSSGLRTLLGDPARKARIEADPQGVKLARIASDMVKAGRLDVARQALSRLEAMAPA